MASRDINGLWEPLRDAARQFLNQCNGDPVFTAAGAKVFIDCTYRSNEEQGDDYAKGRSAPGPKVTDLPAGKSAHNCTLADGTPAAMAFDSAIQLADGKLDWTPTDPLWVRAIQIVVGLGLVSGSQWSGLKDYAHVELKNWRNGSSGAA